MALKHIAIEIGEVVLHGVAPSDRHRVADALRAQLERVLAEPGTQAALARASSVQRLDLPAIRVSGRMRAEPLGAATADALIAGLGAMATEAR